VNMGKALATYASLLSCGPSRFDAWIGGQSDALSAPSSECAQGCSSGAGNARPALRADLSDQSFTMSGCNRPRWPWCSSTKRPGALNA